MNGQRADTQSLRCCGVRVDPRSLDAAVDDVVRHAAFGTGRAVHLCNAYTLSLARRDLSYRDALNRGDLNLPDGMPLVWLARRLGLAQARQGRAYGPDVFRAVAEKGCQRGLRHYLYGGAPEVVQEVAARLRVLAPGIEIVGVESPPFRPLTEAESDDVVVRVREARPDVVWVGLGTPRQDEFLARHRDRLGATLVAIGAAFDFVAGAKPEAPAWMKRSGLEWLFRLKSEPRRLWKRYLVGNAVFVAGVLRGGVSIEPR